MLERLATGIVPDAAPPVDVPGTAPSTSPIANLAYDENAPPERITVGSRFRETGQGGKPGSGVANGWAAGWLHFSPL